MLHENFIKVLRLGNSAQGASGEAVRALLTPADVIMIRNRPFQKLSIIYCMNEEIRG